MEKIKEQFKLILIVFRDFMRDLPLVHGASLAYYTILALVPLLYITFQFFGLFVGDEYIKGIIFRFLSQEIGVTQIEELLKMLDEVDLSHQSFGLKLAGGIMVAFSCTAIVNSLKTSVNTFYGITPKKRPTKKLILSVLIFRLIALLFVIATVLLIMIIYFSETILLGISGDVLENIQFVNWIVAEITRHGLPVITNILVLLFVFKFLHDGKVSWKVARRGALFTGLLLYVGQVGLKIYITNYFFASGAGAAGSILMILVWVYYTSLIVLLGAKFTAAYARSRGEKLNAV